MGTSPLVLRASKNEPQTHWILKGNLIANSFKKIVEYILKFYKSIMVVNVIFFSWPWFYIRHVKRGSKDFKALSKF